MYRHALRGLMAAFTAALGLTSAGVAEATEDTLADRLAAVTPQDGEKVFRRCRSCHTLGRGAAPGVGPNLWGVVGRPVARQEGYDYSEALRELGGAWTPERLDEFLVDPHEQVRGTRMPFVGLDNPLDRAAVIVYLNTMSDAPVDLPIGHAPAPVAPEEPEFGVLVAAPGVEETYAYCSACHSERLVAQQGMTRRRWEKLIEWMVEEQGMVPLEEPERSAVLDYLAENYGPDRPNFPY